MRGENLSFSLAMLSNFDGVIDLVPCGQPMSEIVRVLLEIEPK